MTLHSKWSDVHPDDAERYVNWTLIFIAWYGAQKLLEFQSYSLIDGIYAICPGHDVLLFRLI